MGKKHKKHKSDVHYIDDVPEKTPLKLVLKLGSEVMYDSDYAANSPASSSLEVTSRKSKKRKKKKRHEDENFECRDVASLSELPEKSKNNNISLNAETDIHSPEFVPIEEDMEVEMILPESNKPKASKAANFFPICKVPLKPNVRKALNNLLEHLLKQLERKDTHDIFAWPVNDMIAPGYSSVIDHPMDFSTMRSKIASNLYFNVCEFKQDFDLMIKNCCLYNKPDTVYYDIAKKVSIAGLKIMSKEKLKNARRNLNFLQSLTKQELLDIVGFSLVEDEITDVSEISTNAVDVDSEDHCDEKTNDISTAEELDLRSHPSAVSFTDADNESTVALDALQAMKDAKKSLETRFPKNRIGFLRMDNEGKTTLNIINPDLNEESKRVVDLGALTGTTLLGFDVMPEPKEDKRNKVTPIEYLSYGPFGSFAPTYDSRIANLDQEESDLLLSSYGGDTELLFAKSIQHFVANSSDDLVNMVEDILDNVTHGAHRNAAKQIQAKRNKKDISGTSKQLRNDIKIDFDELKSISDLGINVEFLKEFESKCKPEKQTNDAVVDRTIIDVSKSLDINSILLQNLEKEQYSRLSYRPKNGEPNLEPPTLKEQVIVKKLQQSLSSLTSAVTPGDVCDKTGIRKAMGVSPTL